jgi:glutathione S-transferase
VIKLYQFPPVFGRNISPFTLKLETWLRLAGLPYRVVALRNPGQGPKGKLPFIEDDDGSFIADSSLIIEHLSRSRGIDLDAALGPGERAQALALQRLFEDHLYFILTWSRWLDPEGWRSFGPALFHGIPPPLRQGISAFVRRRLRGDLRAQGLGRHSQAEIYAMGRADLEAIAILLGERRFFFGTQPTTIDAIAYGFLANILLVPIETELERIARGLPALVAWTDSMERRLS